MDSVREWYDSAIINDKEWYICVFGGNQCNEVEDSEEAIVAHVRTQHVRTQHARQMGVQSVDIPLPTPSPSLQSDNELNSKVVTSDEEDADISGQSDGQEFDESYASDWPASGHSMTDDRRKRVYKCRHKGCDFQASNGGALGLHVRHKHPASGEARERPHRCTHSWCDMSYVSSGRLNVHLWHHKCGFKFDDTPGAPPVTGACRRANIDRLVKTTRTASGQQVFECLFKGCVYETSVKTHMRDHIHCRHVCPNRSNLMGRRSAQTLLMAASDETHDDSRDQSSPLVECFQSEEDLDPNCETSDEEERDRHNMDVQSDSSGDERCDSDGATEDQTSAVRLKKGSRNRYKCLDEGCDHRSPSKAKLKLHVREEHPDYESDRQQRAFPCDRPNCRVSYSTRGRLITHLANHRCGYNMDDRPDQVSHPSAVCRRAYVDSHFKVLTDGHKTFKCHFDGCVYTTTISSSIRDHIHGQHLCPNRANLRTDTSKKGRRRRVTSSRRVNASSDEESDDNSEASEDTLDLSSGQRLFERIRKQSVSRESNAIETTEEANVSVGRTQPAPQTFFQSMMDSAQRKRHPVFDDRDLQTSDSQLGVESDSSGSDWRSNRPKQRQSLMSKKRYRFTDGQPLINRRMYTCRHEGCRFKAHNKGVLSRHVRDEHPVSGHSLPRDFRCTHIGCTASYNSRRRLDIHLGYHQCGYNMDDTPDQVSHPSAACRRANIGLHYKRSVLSDGQKGFKCRFEDCPYSTPSITSMRDHIHGQHICPNRANLRVEPKNRTPRQSTSRRADASSDDESDVESKTRDESVKLNAGRRLSPRIANKSVRKEDLRSTDTPYDASEAAYNDWYDNVLMTRRRHFATPKKHNRSTVDQPVIIPSPSAVYDYSPDNCESTAPDKDVLARHMTDNDVIASDDEFVGERRVDASDEDQNDDNSDSSDASVEGDSEGWADVDMDLAEKSPQPIANQSVRHESSAVETPDEGIVSEISSQSSPQTPGQWTDDSPPAQSCSAAIQSNVTQIPVMIGNRRTFKCRHEGCDFETPRGGVLGIHMRDKHPASGHVRQRPFSCPHSWCDVSYATASRLGIHLHHHRCGYNFDDIPGGPPVTGVCRRANLDSYAETRRTIDGQKCYKCTFDGCDGYKTQSACNMREHIHRQHVCPNRSNLIGRRNSRNSTDDR